MNGPRECTSSTIQPRGREEAWLSACHACSHEAETVARIHCTHARIHIEKPLLADPCPQRPFPETVTFHASELVPLMPNHHQEHSLFAAYPVPPPPSGSTLAYRRQTNPPFAPMKQDRCRNESQLSNRASQGRNSKDTKIMYICPSMETRGLASESQARRHAVPLCESLSLMDEHVAASRIAARSHRLGLNGWHRCRASASSTQPCVCSTCIDDSNYRRHMSGKCEWAFFSLALCPQ